MGNFFINRPIFAIVVALMIMLAGLVSIFSLPITQYPNITPPTVNVSASYPGADAQTVAQAVGAPIEQQVNGVEDMVYMSSNSSNGSYQLTITFKTGTDQNIAAVNVQNRVSAAEAILPESVKQQGVTISQQSSNIVQLISIYSDDSVNNDLFLGNYARINLVNELSRLPGVASITVFGAAEYSMRVWFNPDLMQIRGITPQQVLSAIQSQNVQVAAGSVGAPPAPTGNQFEYTLRVQGQLADTVEFGNIILRTESDGSILRLRDVARAELGQQTYSANVKGKHKYMCVLAIYQQAGSNAIQVASEVQAKVKELRQYLPPGVKTDVVLDATQFIRSSISDVVTTFIETTLLVILVILLFLQDWRAVIIPSITIPVTLIGTFFFVKLVGFSLNTMTLFALVLAIAIVVDDAIVVVENTMRILQSEDVTAKEAARRAMKEIGSAIVGIVLVLLAVFVPTAFIGGMTGVLYRQFGLTLAAATVLSGIVSLSLTPALCGILLKKPKDSNFFIFKRFRTGFEDTTKLYVRIITYFLRKPIVTLATYAVLTVIAIIGFLKWPSEFVPQEDQGYFMVMTTLPNAASLDRTMAANQQLKQVLNKYPEIQDYILINGFSIMNGMQSNGGTAFAVLKDWKDRPKKSEKAQAIEADVTKDLQSIQEASFTVMNPSSIPGLGQGGALQYVIQDINNLGSAALQQAVNEVQANAHKFPQLMMTSSFYNADVPYYQLKINRDQLGILGVNIDDVFSTLSLYLGSAFVNDFNKFGQVYQVLVEANSEARVNINDVMKLTVPNANGGMVPLSAFTTYQEGVGTNVINRYNMYESAQMMSIPMIGYSSSQGIQAVDNLIKTSLGNTFSYSWTGEAFEQIQSGSSVALIFILALVVVLMVLAAQYESVTNPFATILSLPLALLGAIIGCILFSQPISIYSQIGIILLIALSTKNGILIVEFARDYRATGQPIFESALEAGRVRFRPIMMTSVAFVLGVSPLLFANSAGAESQISLGSAVVFGMLLNAVVGTLYVPSSYFLMEWIQEKLFGKPQIGQTQKDQEV